MTPFPIRTAGVDGFVVSFGDRLSEAANRAALAFRAAIDEAGWAGLEETSTSLVSTYVRFDHQRTSHADIRARLQHLLTEQDWLAAALPSGRRLWRVPAAYGGQMGPRLQQVAAAIGLSEEEAIAELSQTRVRVQTIGFAPGMPYLGDLPPRWDIPRLTDLTPQVPPASLCLAIRQLVWFPVATPTGWHHVAQTAFRLFRPEAGTPFMLRPGDEIVFDQTSPETLASLRDDPDGGATWEAIT